MKLFKYLVVAVAMVACMCATAATNSVAFSAFNAISVTNVWSGGTTNPAYKVWMIQPTNPANVYVTCYTKALLVQPKPQGGSLHVPGFTNITVTTWHGLTLSNTLKFAYPDCGYFRIKCTNPPPYTATFGVTCD
jgi:hypothetical protein